MNIKEIFGKKEDNFRRGIYSSKINKALNNQPSMADLAQPIYKSDAVKTDTYLSPYQKKRVERIEKGEIQIDDEHSNDF